MKSIVSLADEYERSADERFLSELMESQRIKNEIKNSMETKINKEGGDTMAAATKITQEQIDELIRKGKANKGVLTYGDVMNLTNTLEDITPEDVEHIYEVITRKGLELVDDDNASDEDILPLVGNDEDNDEPSSSESENMSVPEGISIDDPVRMYLKEIGRVPLLIGEDEVKLAKRMDKGRQAERIQRGRMIESRSLLLLLRTAAAH